MYRPMNFSEIVGQPVTVKELSKRSKADTIPHVTILAGDTGTGKTTTAFILAAAINCQSKKPDGSPCGTCPSCRDVFEETFSRSVKFMDASTMGKDDILTLSGNLEGGSLFGERKIVILDEAQELSSKAFGACLRLLENNDEDLYFILCTMRPDKIDRAILGRGIVYRYKSVDFDSMLTALGEELKRRGVFDSVSPDFIQSGLVAIAENAHGSVREALQLLDRAVESGLTTAAELESELGLTESITMRELLEAYSQQNGPALVAAVRKLTGNELWVSFSKVLAEIVTASVTGEPFYFFNKRLTTVNVKDPVTALATLNTAIRNARDTVGYDAPEVVVGNILMLWKSQQASVARGGDTTGLTTGKAPETVLTNGPVTATRAVGKRTPV